VRDRREGAKALADEAASAVDERLVGMIEKR